MRITGKVVATVGRHAEEFTGGAFRYQGSGADIGHGARYFDGIQQQVWLGRGAARQAAAYYIGAMLGWARETDTSIPDEVREYCKPVQESYRDDAAAPFWEKEGVQTAQFRARQRAEGLS